MKKLLLTTLLASTLLLANQKPYEVTITIGGTSLENDLKLDDHKNYGLRFSLPNTLILPSIFDTTEFIYERSMGVDYENINLQTDINRYSVNLLHTYKNFEKITPYLMFGIGYEDFKQEYLKVNDSFTTNLGAGLKYTLYDGVNLRAEIRDQINLENDVEHEIIYTAGIGFSFGEQGVKKAPKKQEKLKKPQMPPIVSKKQKTQETQKKQQMPLPPKIVQIKDSDKDGVLDNNDKCPNTLEGFKVDQKGCPLAIDLKVQFDTNKIDIKDKYLTKLKKFVDFMKMSKSKVEIQGHTDSVGTKKYNQILSQKRAKAVMNKLIELGLQKDRLVYKGYGESMPIASNDTIKGKSQNRRVEAKIIK